MGLKYLPEEGTTKEEATEHQTSDECPWKEVDFKTLEHSEDIDNEFPDIYVSDPE